MSRQPACIPLGGPWLVTPVSKVATVKLTKNLTSEEAIGHSKISIVGTGLVAMACATKILQRGLSDDCALVAAAEGKPKVKYGS